MMLVTRLLVLLCIVIVDISLVAGQSTITIVGESNSNPECPCIDASSILATHSNCFLDDNEDGGSSNSSSSGSDRQPGILIGGTCNPLSYGSNHCGAHDLIARPECSSTSQRWSAPAYCSQQFCYVDPKRCRKSTEHYYKSSFEGMYYSYSTCGSSAQQWIDFDTINALANKTLVVAVPTLSWPFHYKLDDYGNLYEQDSPQVYDETIPWQGIFIDYFNAVVGISSIGPIEYVHRSKGSQTKAGSSPSAWTQAVSDVQAGVADLAISDFWVTTERLAMTSFSVPIALDSFVLWIPQPDNVDDSVWDSFQKILMPFSMGLWISIFGSILTFALLSVLVSPEDRRTFQNENPLGWERMEQWWIILTDSLSTSAAEFLGGAVDPTKRLNLSQKCLNAGFAFIIFITVTAYTANLAAFLTLSGTTNYFNNIEEAISANTRICAHYNVKSELQLVYPNARWVFRSATSTVKEAYANGECGAIVLGWTSVRSSPLDQEFFCEHKLVRVGHSVIDKQVAFPIQADLAAGLSHWIAQAQTVGISYDSYIKQTDAQCNLDILVSSGDDGDDNSNLQQLTTNNLMLPLVGFIFSCILAVVIHFAKGFRKSEMRQSIELSIRSNIQSNLRLMGVETETLTAGNKTEQENGTAQSEGSINNTSQRNLKKPSSKAVDSNESSIESIQETMARLCAQQDLILRTLAQEGGTKEKNNKKRPVHDKNHHLPNAPLVDAPSNNCAERHRLAHLHCYDLEC